MTDKKHTDEGLEKLMNELAESVLRLSDEAILAESREVGTDPKHEAERTRLVLRQASRTLGNVNKRLSNLGHAINPNNWRRGQWGYHNNCLNCGSSVTVTTATGGMQGKALDGLCPESDQYTIPKREASR